MKQMMMAVIADHLFPVIVNICAFMLPTQKGERGGGVRVVDPI